MYNMQFPRCNSYILHEQFQQTERFTDASSLLLSQWICKMYAIGKIVPLSMSVMQSIYGNIWHCPPGTPSVICTIVFLAIPQICMFMHRASRRACRKEESKPLSLGEPHVLRFDKCCQALLFKVPQIWGRVDQASRNRRDIISLLSITHF